MSALDQATFLWLNLGPLAPHGLVKAAQLASLQLPHWIIAALLAVGLTGRPGLRATAWRALLGILLAAGTAALLKQCFQHPRPFTLGMGTQWLPHGATAGFASAHAATAAALATGFLLAPLGWPARALVLAAALAMSWSRMALGLHFPSDVLAGWLLGAGCALAVRPLRLPAGRQRRLAALNPRDRS